MSSKAEKVSGVDAFEDMKTYVRDVPERNKKHENLIKILVTVRVLSVESNFFELHIGIQEAAFFHALKQ